MTILIIEDEIEAEKNIVWLLKNLEPKAEILATIDSVAEGIVWLRNNPQPDLIIADIQLADGNSFEIFEQSKPTCPVIFTTAHNEYAIQSFEVHSIDYLLKPISLGHLDKALQKYKSLKISALPSNIAKILQQFSNQPKIYRQSFLVRYREKILPIKTESFAYFYIKESIVYGKTFDDNQYVIESKMEDLEQQLNPSQFFRANRQFIVSREAIREIDFYFNGRLSLKTKPVLSEHMLISKERIPVFKKWFEAI
jgi:two-component system, LytTR family, response regulator LytT